MQIVYLSKRPRILEETVGYVEKFMEFVTGIVVVCPENLFRRFRFESRLPVRFVADRELLGKEGAGARGVRDHQMKNWLLRAGLAANQGIDDEFIMSDDDSRPLMNIPLRFFKEGGRYIPFYYYRLERWHKWESEYDLGLHNTCRVLKDAGCSTLAFSCHMPQIINREFLARAVKAFDRVGRTKGIDEWSIYFNFCLKEFPGYFAPPRPFETLCWPALPTDWPYDLRPERFSFENFYPELYGKRMLFAGIPTRFSGDRHVELTVEKVRRRLDLQAGHDRMKDLVDLSRAFSMEMGLARTEIHLRKADYAFKISGLPGMVFAKVGTDVDLDIVIEAAGKAVVKEDLVGPGAIRLSLHWLDRNGSCFSFAWIRQPLPGGLVDGRPAHMVLRIPVHNRKPGIYMVALDMVRGKRGWFDGENFTHRTLIHVYE